MPISQPLTMSIQPEPIAMSIDSDHPASDHSDSSQVSYTDDYETLPSSAPTTHAHIVDLGEYVSHYKEDGMVKLQDAVVTTLYSISPDTLRSFLSPTINTFKAVFGKKDIQLIIWRKGLEVLVSCCTNMSKLLLIDRPRLELLRITQA